MGKALQKGLVQNEIFTKSQRNLLVGDVYQGNKYPFTSSFVLVGAFQEYS